MDEEKQMFERAWDWVLVNGLDLAVNLAIFGIIILVGLVVINQILKVARVALKKAPRVDEILENFLINVLHKVLLIILVMIALPRLGVDIGPMIAGLGVAGFVIGFAFQESLGNLAAGLMIILNKPYKIGDYVEASGTAGSVNELNMMATTLLTPDNKKIIIPNSKVWGNNITNYSTMPTRRVDMSVGISYSSDIGKAIETIKQVVASNEKVLDDPATTIQVSELADSSVNIVVRPWCNTADYWGVFFDITRRMKEALDEAGIEIPFPQMDIHVQDMPKPQ